MTSSEEFYQKQINSLTNMLERLKKEGINSLCEIDKPKGVEWAESKLLEQIRFFKDKLNKEKYGRDNKI